MGKIVRTIARHLENCLFRGIQYFCVRINCFALRLARDDTVEQPRTRHQFQNRSLNTAVPTNYASLFFIIKRPPAWKVYFLRNLAIIAAVVYRKLAVNFHVGRKYRLREFCPFYSYRVSHSTRCEFMGLVPRLSAASSYFIATRKMCLRPRRLRLYSRSAREIIYSQSNSPTRTHAS